MLIMVTLLLVDDFRGKYLLAGVTSYGGFPPLNTSSIVSIYKANTCYFAYNRQLIR